VRVVAPSPPGMAFALTRTQRKRTKDAKGKRPSAARTRSAAADEERQAAPRERLSGGETERRSAAPTGSAEEEEQQRRAQARRSADAGGQRPTVARTSRRRARSRADDAERRPNLAKTGRGAAAMRRRARRRTALAAARAAKKPTATRPISRCALPAAATSRRHAPSIRRRIVPPQPSAQAVEPGEQHVRPSRREPHVTDRQIFLHARLPPERERRSIPAERVVPRRVVERLDERAPRRRSTRGRPQCDRFRASAMSPSPIAAAPTLAATVAPLHATAGRGGTCTTPRSSATAGYGM